MPTDPQYIVTVTYPEKHFPTLDDSLIAIAKTINISKNDASMDAPQSGERELEFGPTTLVLAQTLEKLFEKNKKISDVSVSEYLSDEELSKELGNDPTKEISTEDILDAEIYVPEDPKCRSIVKAMNSMFGITVFDAQSGTKTAPFTISFLTLDDDYWYVKNLLYVFSNKVVFDKVTYDFTKDWQVTVGTDPHMQEIIFQVLGPAGEKGVKDAEQMANIFTDMAFVMKKAAALAAETALKKEAEEKKTS